MRATVKQTCSCGAILEVSADAYFLAYLTERLQAFEAEHRGCRPQPETVGPQAPMKPVLSPRPAETQPPTAPTPPAPEKSEAQFEIFDPPLPTCPECGTKFKPDHGRQKICSDECRKKRQQRAVANATAKRKAEQAAKVDADDREARELQAAQRLAAAPTVQIFRREPSSNLQAAPRIKPRRRTVQHLPPHGGYAPPGSPEAAAAIERVKQEQSAGGGSDSTDYPPF